MTISQLKFDLSGYSLRDRLIHKLLSTFFTYRDIVDHNNPTTLYLRRYFITKKSAKHDKRVFIHFLARSDADRHLHDHPWKFTSYILLGGYSEETFMFEPGDPTIQHWYGPLSKLVRPAEWQHRLHMDKPSWTLIVREGRKRTWGFWVDKTFVPWNIYLNVNEEFDEDMEKLEAIQ